jgi:hypothetical protein
LIWLKRFSPEERQETSFPRAGAAMCDKCQELEWKNERYRRIMTKIDGDPQLAVGIAGLIKEAEAEKIAFHRREQPK